MNNDRRHFEAIGKRGGWKFSFSVRTKISDEKRIQRASEKSRRTREERPGWPSKDVRWTERRIKKGRRGRERKRGDVGSKELEEGGEGFAEGFGIGMHDARSEITGFAEPAIMAL